MAKIIVVTSGKGGVGKTTTSASFATGLALRGHKTAVIDFDVGLRNLDLIMGCERRVVYDLINVINEEIKLSQALIRDKQLDKLYILAASQTRDKDALTHAGVERVLEELKAMDFEFIADIKLGKDTPAEDSPGGIAIGSASNIALRFDEKSGLKRNAWKRLTLTRRGATLTGTLDAETLTLPPTQEGAARIHLLHSGAEVELGNLYLRELK